MTTTDDAAARVRELAASITSHREAYYLGAPVISDFEYDQLEDELRGLLAEHPDLTPDPNPLEQVGAPAVLHAPVRHDRPMLSLEKATTPEQVEAFMARFPAQRVVVMPKLDGLSLSIVYERRRLLRAATRGDGTTGEDVTPIARELLDGVPDRIGRDGRIEVRGEAVMLRSTFAAYNAAHPDKPLINPRNGAAGTLRQKDPSKALDRRLAFFAFDIHPPVDTDLEDALQELGLQTPQMVHADTAEEAIAAIRDIEATRGDSDADLDGAVVRLANPEAYAAAGARANSPRGALAFKFPAEEKTTVLRDVVWDVGKIGKVAPVALLEPVFIAGTTVRRATLANQEVIRARDVRIGDTVLVRRAGDVIPFVAGPLDASKRTGEEREIEPPTHCPSCGSELEEEGTGRELYCRASDTCPAQAVRRLIHWASRAAADIEAVGPTWIERLNETGKLASIADFYALTREDLLEYEGIGEVSADRMIDSIAASRGVGLRRALIGFAIRHVGEGAATRLVRAGFSSIEEIADASVEDLVRVEDIGPAVASSLRAFFDREEARAQIALLRDRGVNLDVLDEDRPPEVAADAPLAGKTVVVTGAMADPRSGEKIPRPAFSRLVERAGATVASSVSSATDMLICGDGVGASKTEKAAKLDVEVVGQEEVWRQLIEAGIA
ncbi:MAG TPA: NAD-dependent DNA ligase LigA [Solirubrobacteraceae bacterium]|nr:NAD-dependent DNA ligase LigA [Solirubrobacteraceae bacterium]